MLPGKQPLLVWVELRWAELIWWRTLLRNFGIVLDYILHKFSSFFPDPLDHKSNPELISRAANVDEIHFFTFYGFFVSALLLLPKCKTSSWINFFPQQLYEIYASQIIEFNVLFFIVREFYRRKLNWICF